MTQQALNMPCLRHQLGIVPRSRVELQPTPGFGRLTKIFQLTVNPDPSLDIVTPQTLLLVSIQPCKAIWRRGTSIEHSYYERTGPEFIIEPYNN